MIDALTFFASALLLFVKMSAGEKNEEHKNIMVYGGIFIGLLYFGLAWRQRQSFSI